MNQSFHIFLPSLFQNLSSRNSTWRSSFASFNRKEKSAAGIEFILSIDGNTARRIRMATLGNFSGETRLFCVRFVFSENHFDDKIFFHPEGNFAGIMRRRGRRERKFEMIFYYRDSYVSAGIETSRRGIPYSVNADNCPDFSRNRSA